MKEVFLPWYIINKKIFQVCEIHLHFVRTCFEAKLALCVAKDLSLEITS